MMEDQHRASSPRRAPYRPPNGLPLDRQGGGSAVVAVLFHAVVVLLLFAPAITTGREVLPLATGAGGEGPAGGGGGGRRGTGGFELARERLEYMQVQERAQTPAPAEPEPEPVPEAEPVIVPPPEPERPEVERVAAPAVSLDDLRRDLAATLGTGGGSGTDGTTGDGPGTGGGVGSGIGTGRGSGVGPGTGGGSDVIHPPMPVQFFLPPLPAPERIRPYHMVAVFDVDEEGNVISFEFNESRDRSYNRRLREVLRELRFRPAVTPDGRPVRARAIVSYEL